MINWWNATRADDRFVRAEQMADALLTTTQKFIVPTEKHRVCQNQWYSRDRYRSRGDRWHDLIIKAYGLQNVFLQPIMRKGENI